MSNTGMGSPGIGGSDVSGTGTTGTFGTTGTGESSSTKDEAKAQAGNLAGSARDEAATVADEAKAQARNVMDDARTMVDQQSRTQRDRLVETARSFSGDLEQMAQSGPDGMAGDITRQVADKVRSLSEQLDGREPADILEDVRRFARRRPGMFLLTALGAGVVVGRMARGAKDAQSDSGTDMTRASYATGTSPGPYDPRMTPGMSTPGAPVSGTGVNEPGTYTGTGSSGSMPYGDPLAPGEMSDTPLGDEARRSL